MIVLVKLMAVDEANNTASIIVPIIIDTKQPVIKIPKIDSAKGLIKDAEFIIEDNFIIKNVELNIASSDKAFKPVDEKKLSVGDEREYILIVKNKEDKFIDYTLSIKATDFAGNEIKNNYKINFKETKAKQHKIKIKISPKDSSVYFKEPKIFVEKNNLGLDATDLTIYGFAPTGYKKINMTYGKTKKEVKIVNKNNGIFVLRFTNKEREKMKVGNISTKIVGAGPKGKIDIKKIILFNDMQNPTAEIIWPSAYIPFQQDSYYVLPVRFVLLPHLQKA